MKLLKNLFGKEDVPVKSNEDFWIWFTANQAVFYKVVQTRKEIEKKFLDPLSEKLNQLKEGYFFLTGMMDDNRAELILTPDGNIKNIVFVEELVKAAPTLPNWKITALKPPTDIANLGISVHGLDFQKDNLFFYPIEASDYPDEIEIAVVYTNWTEENEKEIRMGTFLFLDNFLGELDSITNIDNVTIIGKQAAEKELIPIEKLKSFVTWRQKEFIEKYEGTRYKTENDAHSILEARLKNDKVLIAVINTELLRWDSKASHPWILEVEISYSSENDSGLPDEATMQKMEIIEEMIIEDLKDFEGYLNIGRQTADGLRTIYFACKDFRKPSMVIPSIQKHFANEVLIEFDIYKDKYWRSFNRFRVS